MIGEGPVRLAALRGVVWATQEGDGEDYILRAGESLVFDRPGLLLVEAISEAQIELLDLAPAPAAQRPRALAS